MWRGLLPQEPKEPTPSTAPNHFEAKPFGHLQIVRLSRCFGCVCRFPCMCFHCCHHCGCFVVAVRGHGVCCVCVVLFGAGHVFEEWVGWSGLVGMGVAMARGWRSALAGGFPGLLAHRCKRPLPVPLSLSSCCHGVASRCLMCVCWFGVWAAVSVNRFARGMRLRLPVGALCLRRVICSLVSASVGVIVVVVVVVVVGVVTWLWAIDLSTGRRADDGYMHVRSCGCSCSGPCVGGHWAHVRFAHRVRRRGASSSQDLQHILFCKGTTIAKSKPMIDGHGEIGELSSDIGAETVGKPKRSTEAARGKATAEQFARDS